MPGASLQLLLAEFDELLLSPALGVGVVMLDGSGAWSLLGKEEIEKGTWSRGELFLRKGGLPWWVDSY